MHRVQNFKRAIVGKVYQALSDGVSHDFCKKIGVAEATPKIVILSCALISSMEVYFKPMASSHLIRFSDKFTFSLLLLAVSFPQAAKHTDTKPIMRNNKILFTKSPLHKLDRSLRHNDVRPYLIINAHRLTSQTASFQRPFPPATALPSSYASFSSLCP